MERPSPPPSSPPAAPLGAGRAVIESLPATGLAVHHAGIPTISSLTLANDGDDPWSDVVVAIHTEPAFTEPLELRLDGVAPRSARALGSQRLTLAPGFLATQDEAHEAVIAVEVRAGERPVARAVQPIRVLPPNHWPGAAMPPELLAAWVRPNSRHLPALLREASRRLEEETASGALDGYQSRDPRRVRAMVRALYQSVQAAGLRYITPPASFEEVGQRVRTPSEVGDQGMGTCVDLAVLLAALMEQCGLHPLLLVVQGHAFQGVWLHEFSLQEPVIDDPLPIRKRVELGEAHVFDSSSVAQGVPFSEATQAAERALRDASRFRFAIDVVAARRWGVRPLPGDGGAPEPAPDATRPRVAGAEAPLPDRWMAPEAPAEPAPRSRLDKWSANLLDLSLRNRLLNFRLGQRALDLSLADPAPLEDALARGETVALQPRPELTRAELEGLEGEAREARRRERVEALAAEAWPTGVVIVDHPPAELEKRALELFRSSRTHLQESGAVTLYVALGELRWLEAPGSAQPRSAPLLLVPVELIRPTRGEPWRLRRADEEARVNVTLLQKLRAEFGVDPAGLDVPPTDEAGVDVPRVLRRFRELVRDLAGWEVRESVWLAEFSFTKFLMWLDLEAKREALLRNPVVQHIFAQDGTSYPLAAPLVPERELDRARVLADTVTVTDADPSQLQAILAAVDGSSFVLQGPPGTGKSQTITNLIAQLLERGRTVLFVSEKLAALDVVQRRLERVGLGPFCLELHSHQASRKGVIEQLKRSFAHAGLGPPEGWEEAAAELDALRDQLNAHAERLAAPSPFGGSVRDVGASLFGLRDVPARRLALPTAEMTPGWIHDAMRAARDASAALLDAGELAAHPWRGVTRMSWTPAWQQAVREAVAQLHEATLALHEAVGPAAAALRLDPPPAEVEPIARLAEAAGLLLETPAPPAALLDAAGLRERVARLRAWADRAEAVLAERGEVRAHFRDEVLQLPVKSLHAEYQRWAGAFFLFALLMLWSARSRLQRVARGALPAARVVRDRLGHAVALREGLAEVDGWAADGARWLGARWAGLDTDWAQVREIAAWAERAHRVRGALEESPGGAAAAARWLDLATDRAEQVEAGGPVRAPLQRLVAAHARWAEARAQLVEVAALDPAEAWGEAPSLEDLSGWAERALGAGERLRGWCAARSHTEALRALGLGAVADGLRAGVLPAAGLERTLDRALREQWWEQHLERTPELAAFRGVEHARLVERFRALDEQLLTLSQRATAARLAARVPELQGPGDELALLRRQMQLKARHLPMRTLFARVPALLRRLKPCTLMSPLSVAQFLDPELAGFDVVVFDEASQIPPWDAIGAIARGEQVIVVGDSKQLPPTTFFATREEDDLLDEHDIAELESILDEATAAGLPQLRLRWHYRSRHESLIAFSNHHYYEGGLHTFPSADTHAAGRGVQWVHVPGGFYDRGGSRTNRAEAEAVVAELVRLLRLPEGERPTVGVVTFSMTQQRLIEDLVDAAAGADPHLQLLLSAAADEPVFIKNLENVQGDERDVMLFSVGYGPDRQGRVTMNFGPLNRDGGERRLNVAVTRARDRLVVFSTLRHDQIDLSRTRAVGVAHLRAFLRYAELGVGSLGAEVHTPAALTFESPFEEEVHAFLTARGHDVHTQVGCGGYRVDLAVVHPERPGTYLLAVECDGATYHASATARARDRLRDAVLRQLGWITHRVWSTDWWYERPSAEARLLAAVDAALAEHARREADRPSPSAPAPATAAPAPPPVDVDALLQQAGSTPASLPDGCAPWPGLPGVPGGAKEAFHDPASTRALALGLYTLARAVGPVLKEDAYRHVAAAWGWSGLGRRVTERLDAALAAIDAAQRPVLVEGVLWPAGGDPAAWRAFRPSNQGGPVREAASLPIEEIANAAAWIVARGVSMSEEAAIAELSALFGFGRQGARVVARMREGLDHAVARGRLRRQEGRLTAPSA